MSKRIQNEYLPDDVSLPGETLQEMLETIGMSQAELAKRTGRPKKTINEIIMGKASITPETALQLERVLGVPASFWNNRERQYRENLARRDERERLQRQVEWIREIPVNAMIKFGWIPPVETQVEKVREVLNFFGIASPEQWKDLWRDVTIAYRRSKAFKSAPGALAAWLRRGEIEAQSIPCAPYQAQEFKATLDTIRSLTTAPTDVLQSELVKRCAEGGVAVVFVPELPGTRVSGACRWLTPSKGLVQLSLRHKTDDHLWFTFFHEVGHLLLHAKRVVYIDDDETSSSPEQRQQEEEADRFAANTLIPPNDFERFVKAGRFSKAAIRSFASKINISPGIVTGRLQHDHHVPHRNCNDLKRRFKWAREEDK